MKKFYIFIIVFISSLSFSCKSCGPLIDLRDFSDADLFPPVIERVYSSNASTINVDFNENVDIIGSPKLNPDLGSITINNNGSSLSFITENDQEAGIQYVLEANVSDATGNKMDFLLPFYGHNPNIPELLINEFTTQGSSKHPDIVELIVTKEGNLAGLWIVEGTSDSPEDSLILPPCSVKEGDYILIHFKPQGIDDEVDELSDITQSGGYDASPNARDFWVKGGGGLGGNNGTISVYSAPGGFLIDGVLYSNRTSVSDENYLGFGSTKMLNWSRQILSENGWQGSGNNGEIIPEDGINPDDSTATRSICRNRIPKDTNTALDWHIVPTSSSTFGTENTDEVYSPD